MRVVRRSLERSPQGEDAWRSLRELVSAVLVALQPPVAGKGPDQDDRA